MRRLLIAASVIAVIAYAAIVHVSVEIAPDSVIVNQQIGSQMLSSVIADRLGVAIAIAPAHLMAGVDANGQSFVEVDR